MEAEKLEVQVIETMPEHTLLASPFWNQATYLKGNKVDQGNGERLLLILEWPLNSYDMTSRILV